MFSYSNGENGNGENGNGENGNTKNSNGDDEHLAVMVASLYVIPPPLFHLLINIYLFKTAMTIVETTTMDFWQGRMPRQIAGM